MSATRISRGLHIGGAVLGALGLLGWITGPSWLTTIIPDQPAMPPNTAVGLIAIATAGFLRSEPTASARYRVISNVLATLALAIGVATLTEYMAGIDLHIDQALLAVGSGPHPGRPSPPAAIAFTFLGIALLTIDLRPHEATRPSEWFSIAAAFTTIIGLIGNAFRAAPLYRFHHDPVLDVAVPAALSLLAISIGMLASRSDAGIMRLFTSMGPGGMLMRRLILPVVLAPPLIAWLITQVAGTYGIDDLPVVASMLVVATSGVSLVLLPLTAAAIDRAHEIQEHQGAEIAELLEQASDGIFIADLTGRYTEVNGAGCRLLGREREEIVGMSIADLIPADDLERLSAARESMLHDGTTQIAEWRLRRASGALVPVEISSKILPDGRWQGIVRDITQRKQAEDAVRRAQERLEGIISIATDAIISIDERERITIFNHGAEHIFGWKSGEALGLSLDILIPAGLRERHHAHVATFTCEPEPARRMGERPGQIIGLRKDGTTFPAEAAISKFRSSGETTFTVVLRDMTEQVALERELRDARNFLEHVLESATEYGLIVLDLRGHVMLWNEGARRMFRYDADELIGTSIDGLHEPRDVSAGVVPAMYARALREGSASEILHMHRKDGSRFRAQLVVSRRTAPDGQPVGYLVVTHDVTREHRRREQEQLLAAAGPRLTESLDRSRIVDSAVELIVRELADACVVDLADAPGERDTVRRCCVLHRDPRRQLDAARFEALPSDPRRMSLSWPTLQTGRTTRISHVTEDVFESIAGSPPQREWLRELAPVSLLSVPLLVRGHIAGALTLISTDPERHYDAEDARFVEDIARRLAAAVENARLHEVASHAIEARDDILRVVAHDLRNPVLAAMAGTRMLLRGTDERRDQSQLVISHIQEALGRGNRLIDDLLDVARIDAGKGLHLDCGAIDVGRLLASARAMVADTAIDAEIDIEIDVAPNLPLVWGDDARIVRVFENLIGNALKFTPPGGRIVLGAKPQQDGCMVFRVSDTGSGMSPDDMAHVFDRFWQGNKTGTAGAGLGLTIARAIIEAHQGRIWVESAVGAGCTFWFTLPTAPPAVCRLDQVVTA